MKDKKIELNYSSNIEALIKPYWANYYNFSTLNYNR